MKAAIYSVSQKSPLRFSGIFPKWFGIFWPNFTRLLYVPTYAKQSLNSLISNYDEVIPY